MHEAIHDKMSLPYAPYVMLLIKAKYFGDDPEDERTNIHVIVKLREKKSHPARNLMCKLSVVLA